MSRTLLATMAIATCAACAPEPIPPATPAPAPAPVAAPSPGAPTSAQPRDDDGSIGGTVATNPYHAIKGGGVVYLEDGPRETGTPLSATLDNHDMEFVPSIVVVPAGGSVIFTNTDPMMHNVFSPDGEKWNLGEIPQNGSVVKRFDNPGAYTVLCNLHTSMIAHLLVPPRATSRGPTPLARTCSRSSRRAPTASPRGCRASSRSRRRSPCRRARSPPTSTWKGRTGQLAELALWSWKFAVAAPWSTVTDCDTGGVRGDHAVAL